MPNGLPGLPELPPLPLAGEALAPFIGVEQSIAGALAAPLRAAGVTLPFALPEGPAAMFAKMLQATGVDRGIGIGRGTQGRPTNNEKVPGAIRVGR